MQPSLPPRERPRRGTPRPDWYDAAAIRARSRSECAERRARVLKHPDLAKRLTQQPLNYAQPEMWNGYVPPADGPWGRSTSYSYGECETCGKWHGRDVHVERNDSPQRAALVDICAEALRREQRGESEEP